MDPVLLMVLVWARMSKVCSNILSGSFICSSLFSSSIVLSLLGSSFNAGSISFVGTTSGFPVKGLLQNYYCHDDIFQLFKPC